MSPYLLAFPVGLALVGASFCLGEGSQRTVGAALLYVAGGTMIVQSLLLSF